MPNTEMYQHRMIGYYPEIIAMIKEFQAIITAEAPEFDLHAEGRDHVLADAYISTMQEDRISQWEKALGIIPVADSTVSDRRETVIARIRGQGKLNTAAISSIVNAFTGGTANSWVANSTLYVEITPPPTNKSYKFANVEQELKKKVPAHIKLNVYRNYFEWGELKSMCDTWQDVKDTFDTWGDVVLYIVT